MSPHRFLLVATIVVGVVAMSGAAVAAPGGGPVYETDDEHIQPCAAEVPEDFSDPENASNEAVIGWVDGYWYNEPLEIDVADGLTEEELEKLSARTAARFEAMRCLTFEEIPPIEILTREEFQESEGATYDHVDDQTQRFDNAQFEAMLLIGSEEDSLEVREANRGETVGGFYNFRDNEIVVVSDDPDELSLDEEILAHELGHAAQDQQFNLSRYNRSTNDLDKGKLGVIEGDVHLIEHRYLEACEEDRWEEPCLREEQETDGEGADIASWGLYFNEFQPYSDGPSFVKYVYEEHGGWDAVDELYEEMPRTALHVIYPEKYGEVQPYDLTVPDESGDEFERMTSEEGVDYNEIGQAGLVGMFVSPMYEATNPTQIAGLDNLIDPEADGFFNYAEDGELDPINPLDYDQPAANGWRGDRLFGYENDAGETGVVWKLAWKDDAEAEQFVAAYEDLIEFRNGQPTEYGNVYEFGFESDFDMALSIQQEDDRVWIVTAPTVEEIPAVHGAIDLEGEEDTGPNADDGDDGVDLPEIDDNDDDGVDDPDPTDDGQEAAADDDRDADGQDAIAGDDGIPGFGVAVAIVALLGAAAIARRP